MWTCLQNLYICIFKIRNSTISTIFQYRYFKKWFLIYKNVLIVVASTLNSSGKFGESCGKSPLFGLLWMWKGKYDLRHGVQKCCACYSIQQTPRTGLFQHKRQKWKLTEEMWYQSQLNTNNNIHTRTLQYVNENHFIW